MSAIASEYEACADMVNFIVNNNGDCINLNGLSVINQSNPVTSNGNLNSVNFPSNIIFGTPTEIKSTAEGMISYRNQDHAWITEDGSVHALVKDQLNNKSLSLYSKMGNSSDWVGTFSIPSTGYQSTCDGILEGNELFLSYSSSEDLVYFAQLKFDDLSKTWKSIKSSPVSNTSRAIASRPSISLGDDNHLWVAFISKDSISSESELKLFSSNISTLDWQEINIGNLASSKSDRISAKVVTLTSGVAIIYSDDGTLNWAYHSNSWPISVWKSEKLFESKEPNQLDPKGSHFSVVVDEYDNIHVATNDGQNGLLYFKYDYNQDVWETPQLLSKPNSRSANYMQISLAQGGELFITYDLRELYKNQLFSYLNVLKSSDSGKTFLLYAHLAYQPALEKGNQRIETPAYVNNALPVFQQVSNQNDSTQSLIYFNVPTW